MVESDNGRYHPPSTPTVVKWLVGVAMLFCATGMGLAIVTYTSPVALMLTALMCGVTVAMGVWLLLYIRRRGW